MTDLEQLAVAIAERFPDARPAAPLTHLGAGEHSITVETAGGVVFRVGKAPGVSARYEREMRLLPWLGGLVQVPIPQPRWRSDPSALFPHGVIGYPKLPGERPWRRVFRQLGWGAVPAGLARFLAELHRIPVDEALDRGAPGPAGYRAWREELPRVVLPPLRAELPHAEYRRVVAWWDAFLGDPAMDEYEPALVHADAVPDNVLVDVEAATLTAVLDFEHMYVSDRAIDLAGLRWFGEDFQRLCLEGYVARGGEIDPPTEQRMQRLWQLSAFYTVRSAASEGSAKGMQRGLDELRDRGVIA